ncbi:MAG TPA: hypothetical protein VH120_07590, partial [Gemmataceae bacterium]|nr:hypothetical protein [Gemmataceae bacterium]
MYTATRMSEVNSTAVTSAPTGVRRFVFWLALAVLLTAHAVLSLQMFGSKSQWRRLLSDDPVTSGRHALHLEQSLAEAGRGSFDPSCYAGYTRTALFDVNAEPAVAIQRLAGRRAGASAYKVGLLVVAWVVPWAAAAAAALLRAGRLTVLAAAGLGILASWFGPAAEVFEVGEIWLPEFVALVILGASLLWGWHRRCSALSLSGLIVVNLLGWMVQPAAWLAVFAAETGGWWMISRGHGWRWHLALGTGLLAALALSYPSWADWPRDWWMRLRDRPTAPALPVLEIAAAGLWVMIVPAALLVAGMARWLVARPSAGFAVGSAAFLLTAGVLAGHPSPGALRTWWGPRPLSIGLPEPVGQLEAAIRTATLADARVLWEDLAGRPDLGWTALLPRRLGRPFVGGLDPDGVIEHAGCALRDGTLCGRPVARWSDAELDGYARRYNIGCVVCGTPASSNRVGRWAAAAPVRIDAPGDWRVFVLHRPHSFILKGEARQLELDGQRVTMADVVPEDGEVVLSLHYQDGWRVRPAGIRIERELDPYDSI